MEAWSAVLAREQEGSRLAWLLRLQLVGVRSTLASAAATQSDDPALAEVERLMAELDNLLPASSASALPAAQPVESEPFWDDVLSEPSVTLEPKPVTAVGAPTDIDLLVDQEPRLATMRSQRPGSEHGLDWWRALYLVALALDEQAARRWPIEIARVSNRSSTASASSICAGPEELELVPALSTSEGEAGLRISPAGRLDQRIADLQIDLTTLDDSERQPLVEIQRFVSLWLTLIDYAPALTHCLEGVNRYGSIALQGDQQTRYERALIRRFSDLVRHTGGEIEANARAWVAIDEALQAVMFDPLEERSSRFASWKREARNLVLKWLRSAQSREPSLQVRTLPEDYAQVQREGLTQRRDDIPLKGQRSGSVLATLRLWLRCGGREEQGRALYGSG